ncbi:putative cobalt transporter in sulfate-reducing delta-proteobacteria [Methanosarcina siciliae T4/M]|uniref:Putative cobalt transporter in sulfate-reducing delta-proteobacteria n=2 Tax=Methanosarcina siciliae TaxID=38027 RepID=A0A0E3PEJ2_9EURY|nr:nucleoside recognition domain-containing protein [Methanosarcina siciliae]AKB29071.1 putative cobalt transporter in sulfate-reducing delta-proteobacteria [Methanosarcina siciliae T4/M]AKB33024.1 putative cobalt transporter in sulfate-reducing delta-proteobacteria [Methanosarcina siciliae HI350]
MLPASLIHSAEYLLKTGPSIIIGVVLAELLVSLGWFYKFDFLVRPITNYAHLRKECGVGFLTAFASTSSANASLKSMYDGGIIKEDELIIASVLNSFPAIVMHWKTLLPILVPLLGTTGIIYVGLITLVGFIKTLIVLIVGHFLLEEKEVRFEDFEKKEPPVLKTALKESLGTSKKTLIRIFKVMIPVTVLVFILTDLGVFDTLGSYLEPISEYLPVPVEGLPVIAALFASHLAAYTLASNLMEQGILSGIEVIIVLLVGNIVTSLGTLRIYIPHYVGIFGPKIGMKTILISQTLRIFVMLGITGVILMVF